MASALTQVKESEAARVDRIAGIAGLHDMADIAV
jgi:hypothetical protein